MIEFSEYSDFGFCVVSEPEFGRFRALAEAAVRRFTSDRVNEHSITLAEKYALCEIIDAFAAEAYGRGRLTSFSNDGYSESYAASGANSAEERIENIVRLCFEKEKAWRGVMERESGAE